MCGIWRIAQLLGGSSELKNYSMGVFLVLLASTAPEGVPLGYSELGVPLGCHSGGTPRRNRYKLLTQINVKLERLLNTHGVILEFRGTS